MDFTIEIDRMRLYAHHGVMEQERHVGNFFEVSVAMTYDVDDNATITDDLDTTVNYADIAAIIRQEMATPSSLLEHVAFRIRQAILQRYPEVRSGYVKIAKTTPPLGAQMRSASATLKW